MSNFNLTAQRLREVLHYEPTTGFFYRRISAPGLPVGAPAGYVRKDGYSRISVDGQRHLAHRLAWLYTHGEWPVHEIDHINACRSDNRILNLRDITSNANRQNQRNAQKKNKTGFLGVCFRGKSWVASIHHCGKVVHIGSFQTPELAHSAYVDAKRALHGEGCTI